jgi:hypothetical protein
MSTGREIRYFKDTGGPKDIAKMDLEQRVKWSLLSAGPCIQMMQEAPRVKVSS